MDEIHSSPCALSPVPVVAEESFGTRRYTIYI